MTEELVARLKILRKNKGLTCQQLSEMIGRQDSYIARVERGKYGIPNIEDLEKIVDICGSCLEQLFYDIYETYYEEKNIREKFRDLSTDSRDIVIRLLTVLHKQEENEKRRR